MGQSLGGEYFSLLYPATNWELDFVFISISIFNSYLPSLIIISIPALFEASPVGIPKFYITNAINIIKWPITFFRVYIPMA